MDFDLDRQIEAGLGQEPASDVELQAQSVLIDAELSDERRSFALRHVMQPMLESLSTEQFDHFLLLAKRDGEAAALVYLGSVARPAVQREHL
jgi:hypothetical protein